MQFKGRPKDVADQLLDWARRNHITSVTLSVIWSEHEAYRDQKMRKDLNDLTRKRQKDGFRNK